MRMRNWALAVAATALAAMMPSAALAQKPVEPTVEIRLRSVNDLLDKAEYIGGLVDKDEPIKQVRGLVKQLSTDGKGLEGVDTKKPFGAYAVVTPDAASSPVIVMVPIADQDRFLMALKDRLQIVPEKAEGGTLKANVPLINEVYLRFTDGYLYLGRTAKDLDAKSLISPKTFFANDDGAVVSVSARFDRIPDDVRTLVIGQFEHQVQEGLKKNAGNKNAVEKKLEAIIADAVVGSAKLLADDGKELSLKVFADAKTDELSVEVAVTAKDGSTLAKNIAGLSGKTSLPAGITASTNATIRGTSKIELTDDLKKRLGPIIDAAAKEGIDTAGDREAARRVIEPLAEAAKTGRLDLAASFIGPDAKGKYSLLAAVTLKGAKDLEKVARDFAGFVPAEAVEITFDVAKVGNFTIHKVVGKAADEQFEQTFGTKNVWIAVSEDCVAMSFEPNGELLKAGLKAKPAAAPFFAVEVALAKAIPLFDKKLKPDEVKALLKDAFGSESPAGKDTIGVSIEGGKQLTMRVKVKGKAIRLASMLEEFKIK